MPCPRALGVQDTVARTPRKILDIDAAVAQEDPSARCTWALIRMELGELALNRVFSEVGKWVLFDHPITPALVVLCSGAIT
jgi:hypothetical protein